MDTLDAPLDPSNANRYTYAANNPVNYVDPWDWHRWRRWGRPGEVHSVHRQRVVIMSVMRGRRAAGRVLISVFALLLVAAVTAVVATGSLAEDWWLIAIAAAALAATIILVRWRVRKPSVPSTD